MNHTKIFKIASNIIYSIGAAIALALGAISLFGSNETIHPDNMIPYSCRSGAFLWLALGTVPMLLACMAVYKFNDIKNSVHKKRNFALVFLPGFICTACALYIVGLIILGIINSFIFNGALFGY